MKRVSSPMRAGSTSSSVARCSRMRSRTSARVIGPATLAAGADRKAPAASSAAVVRATMSSSTARRASRTAFSMPRGPNAAVRHHHGLAQAEQDRAARALGVELARAAPASLPRTSSPPSDEIGPERTASRIAPLIVLADALEHLERDVAGEAVGHDHVGPGGGQVEALHVADEVQARRRSGARAPSSTSGVPLPDSSPTLSRPTRGRSTPVHRLHEARAHVGELHEVLGAHLHAGAGVEQQHVAVRAAAAAPRAPAGRRRGCA